MLVITLNPQIYYCEPIVQTGGQKGLFSRLGRRDPPLPTTQAGVDEGPKERRDREGLLPPRPSRSSRLTRGCRASATRAPSPRWPGRAGRERAGTGARARGGGRGAERNQEVKVSNL